MSYPARPFESLVEKTDTCWLWKGRLDRDGYGDRKYAGKPDKAHRVAWRMAFGEIPKGKMICHSCDVRHCVRPDHLFIGSNDANMADMVWKDRQAKGELNGQSKLTEAGVMEMRWLWQRGLTLRNIAERFGVGISTVHRIVHRKAWAHV